MNGPKKPKSLLRQANVQIVMHQKKIKHLVTSCLAVSIIYHTVMTGAQLNLFRDPIF